MECGALSISQALHFEWPLDCIVDRQLQRLSRLSQLGWPDMRLPILYTMSWPERVPCADATWPRLDFVKMGDLTFRSPDRAKYPAMDLAFAAGRAGGTMTGVLSAANEQVSAARPGRRNLSSFELLTILSLCCVPVDSVVEQSRMFGMVCGSNEGVALAVCASSHIVSRHPTLWHCSIPDVTQRRFRCAASQTLVQPASAACKQS